MNKKLKALEKIINEYDAFYITNKYGPGTHIEEFDILIKAVGNDEIGLNAVNWIKRQYDCYYKSEYENDDTTAFAYLKKILGE